MSLTRLIFMPWGKKKERKREEEKGGSSTSLVRVRLF
jgi:hypothetical protein